MVLTLLHCISHAAEKEEREGVEIKTGRQLTENVSGCIRIWDVCESVCLVIGLVVSSLELVLSISVCVWEELWACFRDKDCYFWCSAISKKNSVCVVLGGSGDLNAALKIRW